MAGWFEIFERTEDGRRGGLVFDCAAESIDDAHAQVAAQSWPFGLVVRDVATGEETTFPGNSLRRAAFLRGKSCSKT